jgi:hypothetical protein
MRIIRFAVVAFATLSSLSASPIGIYTFTGSASGIINGVGFQDATLTVTATEDVSDITFTTPSYSLDIPGGVSSFTLSGIGSGTFTDETYVFDNADGVAGFGDDGASHCCDIIQMYDSLIGSTAFATYNLASSIGPLGPEPSDPSTGDWIGLNTSLGSFTVTSYENVIFDAKVGAVPEPQTLPLLGIGMVGLVFLRMRKLHSRSTQRDLET